MAGGNYEKLMYNQYAELVEKFESLQAEFKQASFEQKLVIERLNNQHKDEIAELKAHYEQEIDKRDKEIADLKAANEKLSAEVDRLKSIINNNSRNSSNPPSSDQKPSKKVNPKKTWTKCSSPVSANISSRISANVPETMSPGMLWT